MSRLELVSWHDLEDEIKARELLPVSVDNSALNTWALCERKYYYSEILRRTLVQPTDQQSIYLRYGSAVHECMDVYYSTEDVEKALKKFVTVAHELKIPIREKNVPEDKLKKERDYNIEFGLYLLQYYFQQRPLKHENWEIVKIGNVPGVELGFAVIAGNGIFTGKIDLIVKDKEYGHVFLMDHKTTGKPLGTYYWDQFMINNQITGYLWAIHQLMGEPIYDFQINAIRIFNARKSDSKVKERMFARAAFQRTKNQIAEHTLMVQHAIENISKAKKQGITAFYMNAPFACKSFYQDCEFNRLCKAGTNFMRNQLIKTGYIEKKWDPFEELKEVRNILLTEI